MIRESNLKGLDKSYSDLPQTYSEEVKKLGKDLRGLLSIIDERYPWILDDKNRQ